MTGVEIALGAAAVSSSVVPVTAGTIALGTAGTTIAGSAATAGLFGVGGSFSLAATASTLGTAFSVFSAISAGSQQKDLHEYNAAVQENEAIAARQLAQYEADRHDERTKRLLASQRARFGKSGVIAEGSPLLVMAETARDADLDRQVILHSGDRKAVAASSQAALDRQQGKIAQRAGYLKAGTALVSGVGNALKVA